MNVATIGLLNYAFGALWLVAAVVVLAVLLRLFVQTRMSAFVWLIFALVVWPFVSRVSLLAVPVYLAQRQETGVSMAYALTALSGIETLVGAVLLITAVLILQRQMQQRILTVGTATPPAQGGLPPYQF